MPIGYGVVSLARVCGTKGHREEEMRTFRLGSGAVGDPGIVPDVLCSMHDY